MSSFDPAEVVRQLDQLGLHLCYTRLPNAVVAFAPWHGAGGPQAQQIIVTACVSSVNRVALLEYLVAAGREQPSES